MRPVTKFKAGNTVEWEDTQGKTVLHIIQQNYHPYSEAKFPLLANLDYYCSYCEKKLQLDSAEIEHICPKSLNSSQLEFWENFLLACKTCNTLKKVKLPSANCYFPDENNTFHCFIYDDTGRVKVNPNLSASEQQNAQELLDLVQLQRDRSNATSCDDRWQQRVECWNLAVRYKEKYQKGMVDEDMILDIVKPRGFWSVWFTVMQDIPTLRQRLLQDFKGTATQYFEA